MRAWEATATLRPLLLLAVTSLAVASVAAGFAMPLDAAAEEPRFKSIGQMIYEARLAHFEAEHSVNHPMALPYSIDDPVAEARRVLQEEAFLGATPREWLEAGKADRLLALRPDATQARDLVAETLRLDAMLGVPVSAPEQAAMRAQADAMPAEVRASFAQLVGTVADAYEVDRVVADQVLATWPGPVDENAPLLTAQQRDILRFHAEAIVAAGNAFQAIVAAHPAAVAIPTFSDPEGVVVLGGTAADTHTRGGTILDPVLLVDVGGDDTYLNTAGGACPDALSLALSCNNLALSVVMDLAGNDLYLYDGLPSAVQGAGAIGGTGILADYGGDDRYQSKMTRVGSGPLYQYIDGGAQGFAEGGYGLLLDAEGNDVYVADVQSALGRDIWNFAQGFGSAGGLGIAADNNGYDAWLAHGLGIPGRSGFQGVYNDGVGFYGGVGVMADLGGEADIYHSYDNGTTTDYYALGFGAFGGLGIMYDDGGDDDYIAVTIATNPWIVPLLNCAFGTGSLGGMGVFIDVSGNDNYFGNTVSPYSAETMNEGFGSIPASFGMFLDLSGDDGHFMESHGGPGHHATTAGRGVLLSGGFNTNKDGLYLDVGGTDQYTGAAPSRDGGVWVNGADINTPVDVLAILG